MPRGNNNNNNNHRGRGGVPSRGQGRGRGRGGPNRGYPNTVGGPSTTAPARPPRQPYPHANSEIDVVVQQWRDPPESTFPGPGANRGGNANRGYGTWRGGPPGLRSGAGTPTRGTEGPRRGASTPRGRGRGRGQGRGWVPSYGGGDHSSAPRRPRFGIGSRTTPRAMIGKDAPLSALLFADRPLLRPIKFVRATLTPFLFQHSEEVLKPVAQVTDTAEASHVPTADRVARLFRQTGPGSASNSDLESQAALEEIDFADLAQVREEVDAIAQSIGRVAAANQNGCQPEEVLEEVDFADMGTLSAKLDAAEPPAASKVASIAEEAFTGVYNQTKSATKTSSTTKAVDDNQIHAVQQSLLPSTSLALDDLFRPKSSIKISSLPGSEKSPTQYEDRIQTDEEISYSSNTLLDKPVQVASQSTTSGPHPTSLPTNDIPLHPDSCAPSLDDPHPLFVVDTAPACPSAAHDTNDVILVDRTGYGEMLGDQDEELIVYVAPHPRLRRDSTSPVPCVPRVKLPRTSMLTGRVVDSGGLRSPVREDDYGSAVADRDGVGISGGLEEKAGEEQHLSLASLTLEPSTATPVEVTSSTRGLRMNGSRRARKKEAQRQRKKQRQSKRSRLGSGAYGAMTSDARSEDERERRQPRWETRRRGDSDLDWGTEDEDENEDRDRDGDGIVGDGEVDAVSDGLAGMEIDPDLEIDVDAMKGFLKSMSAEGSRFVTIDDIEDEARMRQEDEEGLEELDGNSSSEGSDEEEGEEDKDEDEEEVFNIEEEILIAEPGGDEELSEDSDDDDGLSPKSGFQARLRKLREQSRGQRPKTVQEISDEEEEDEELPGTRNANDEEFIAHINDLLEENSQILSGHNREQKKAVFRNLLNGYVDDEWDGEALLDDVEFTTPVNKKKNKKGKGKQTTTTECVNAELEAQWAKDRAKKAVRKQERQTARLLAALDPLSAPPKGGRASRKAMHAAAKLDPATARSITPRALVDMDVVELEELVRRFVEDAGGRPRVSLPPMDKLERKIVHEIAAAFGVKSTSMGKGGRRHTTLIRTNKTGVGVNEGKLRALMNRYGGMGAGGKGGRGPKGGREGDEVGKEAPKIGENNIGFKMLVSMGWSEGDRIGGTDSVGIETPLTAIIKRSKLGLGATR